MTVNLKKKKKGLGPGEKIKLCYDECFKIMFANERHMEPLTLLLSNVLQVSYEKLDGKIELVPLIMPNVTIGEKKQERDIVVSFKDGDKDKIIIEVNFKDEFYETIINRNLNYLSEVASKGLKSGETYDKIAPTLLINFNTFYVDNIHMKSMDYYYFRNDEGYILTEKQKILNINIVDCYYSWYNGTYKALTNSYKRDLTILSAAMYTDKIEEFNRCIEELSADNSIKNIIEEVSVDMNGDNNLKLRYEDFLEENKKINESIINDEKKKAKKEGKIEGKIEKERDIVLNMLNKKYSIHEISEITNLSIDEINDIKNFK